MTDVNLVYKKLTLIESYVRELRTFAQPDKIQMDIKEQRFEERTLQMAIQAAFDIAAHIVAEERYGVPDANRGFFELLIRYGWLPQDLAEPLSKMVGFRNILVHSYERVDPAEVEKIVRHHLDDLLDFVKAIRARLASA